MKRVKGRDGFTLVEVLVASSVFVIVGGAIISLFIYGSNIWQLAITQNQLRSGASTAMYYMTQELQNATNTSNQNPSPNLSIPAAPNNTSITFFLPSTTSRTRSDGSTNWNTGTSNTINYQYTSASQQLNRTVGIGAAKTICDNVAAVTFENRAINPILNSDELKITLTVSKNTLMGIKSMTMISIIKLRN